MSGLQRVVHLSTCDAGGGAEKVAMRLLEAQRKAGLDSQLLAGRKFLPSPYTHGFDLHALPPDSLLAASWQYYHYMGSHRLPHHPLIRHADLVHLHNLHGDYFNPYSMLVLARMKPVLWTLHDMHAFTGHCAHSYACTRWQEGCGDCPSLDAYPAIAFDHSWDLWLDKRFIYANVNLCLVAPSEWLKRKVERSILGHQRIELVPNGVDTTVFQPEGRQAFRQRLNLPEDAILVGSLANGGIFENPYKGGGFAADAIAEVQRRFPEVWFLNVGATRLSGLPQVIDLPRVEQERELAGILSALDVFLFPSLAENCPLVVLEAMACGVPIVAFETGGVPELVRDGQEGIIAAYRDANALTAGLITLIADSEFRERAGQSARARAMEHFDHAIIASRYQRLYEETIAARTDGHESYDDRLTTAVRRVMADAAEQRGKLEVFRAEALLRLGAELAADPSEATFQLADLLMENGLYVMALELLETLDAPYRESAACWKRVGIANYRVGDMARAREAFAAAAAIDPGDLDALVSLGDLSLAEDLLAEAQAWFMRACDLDAAEVDAWAGLVLASARMGDSTSLVRGRDQLLRLDPGHPALLEAGVRDA